MASRKLRAGALYVATLASVFGLATRAEGDEVIHPWEFFGSGIVGSYEWPSTLWHVGAVAVTPPLVFTLDSPIQETFQKPDVVRQSFAEAMLVGGSVTPILIPLALYTAGIISESSELATAGAAAIQAVAVQALWVTTLKWLTDRAGPYPDGDVMRRRELSGIFRDSDDPADFDFNPFNLNGGLRWPSGHTASHFALVSALVAFYPKHPWIALVGYPLALAVAVGMIDGDYHWFSDVVAGALIGHAIGWSIGRSFRREFDARRAGVRTAGVGPVLGFRF